jgi:hypothetical protein
MSDSAIALYDESRELSTVRPPEQVLAEARRCAVALKEVISLKDKPVIFNNEQYLEFEDWQTCAKFYGCTVKVVSTNYVEYGTVAGFEAVAVVLDRNQNEISRAESLCLNDEKNWGMVTAHEWVDRLDDKGKRIWDPKGGKNQTGAYIRDKVETKEPKPLFQLKSMAQTRASARALRQVFAWVVVLAGYKPSVAEEMTGNEQPRNDADPQDTTSTADGKKAAVASPQRASEVVEEEISGSISGARLSNQGSLWFHLEEKMVVVAEAKVTDDMVNGSIITVKAKKMKNEAMGEFWGTTTVIKCEPVVEGDTTEDESQDDGHDMSAEDQTQTTPAAQATPAAPDAKAAVAESMRDVFEGGTVKTARQVSEETAAKKEKSWLAHVGHDPAKHISYKQGMLLFTIQNGRKLKDEDVKALLMEEFKIEHRYLIPKDVYPILLDMVDPNYQYHEKK